MTTDSPASVAASAAPPTALRRGQRLSWIDTLRGVATVLVVVLHATLVIELFERQAWEPLMVFNQLFSPYRMALLMLLSGMLLSSALKKPLPEYIVRKGATLLYPYVLWTLVYGLTVYEYGLVNKTLWIGGSYLWFIGFLFTFYMAAPLLRRVPTLLVVLVSFVLSFLAPDGTKYAERYFFLFGCFFLGHYLETRPKVVEFFTAPAAVALALPIAAGFSIFSVLQDGVNYEVEFILPSLAGIVVMMGAAIRYSETRVMRPLNFIGRHSVVFFVIHYPLIYGVMYACLAFGVTNIPAITLLSFAVALPFCWMAAFLRDRSKPFGWLFALPVAGLLRRRVEALQTPR